MYAEDSHLQAISAVSGISAGSVQVSDSAADGRNRTEYGGDDSTADAANLRQGNSKDGLRQSCDELVRTLFDNTVSFQYDFHKPTHTIMVKVIDNETQQVIREIPPEKLLDMVASIWKQAGLILDDKA